MVGAYQSGEPTQQGLSLDLWQSARPLVKQCQYHPFVVSLGDGTLSSDCFLHYESQDIHYLRAFKVGHQTCLEVAQATHAPNDIQQKLHVLMEFMNQANVETEFHERRLREEGQLDLLKRDLTRPTQEYIAFLHELCDRDQSLIHILVSMLPCYRLYAYLGCQLRLAASHNKYQQWIELYSGNKFMSAVQLYEEVVDELGQSIQSSEFSKCQEIYNRAMQLELNFFGKHPGVPDARRIGCVVSDFDETITANDTTTLIVQSIISTRVQYAQKMGQQQNEVDNLHNSLQSSLSLIVELYNNERNEVLKENLPKEEESQMQDFDYELLISIINSMSEFERRSNQRVIDSQLLKGAQIDEVYASVQKVTFREKALEVIKRIIANNIFLRITSVTWCAPFIVKALQLQNDDYVIHSRSFGKASDLRQQQNQEAIKTMHQVASQNRLASITNEDVHKVVIYGNDLEIDDQRVTTGGIIRRVQNGDDKHSALEELLLEHAIYHGGSDNQSIYIGDSITDLLPMLSADVGIVLGDNQLLRRICRYARIQIEPLLSCPLKMSREVLAHKVSIYHAQSWEDIEAFIFGPHSSGPSTRLNIQQAPTSPSQFRNIKQEQTAGSSQPGEESMFESAQYQQKQQYKQQVDVGAQNNDKEQVSQTRQNNKRISFQGDAQKVSPFRSYSNQLVNDKKKAEQQKYQQQQQDNPSFIDTKVDINDHRIVNYVKSRRELQQGHEKVRKLPCVLIIAGSDSGGGAGIQADIKSCCAVGTFATTAITALTAQNTYGVQGVLTTDAQFLRQQLESILSDFTIDAVKIGMLQSIENVNVVAEMLEKYQVKNVVLDPVLVSSSQHSLADNRTAKEMISKLFKHVTIITPNIPETETLLELEPGTIRSVDDMVHYGKMLQAKHAPKQYVVVKGGHMKQQSSSQSQSEDEDIQSSDTQQDLIADVVVGPKQNNKADQGKPIEEHSGQKEIEGGTHKDDEGGDFEVEIIRLKQVGGQSRHGTGCTYSTLIANGLALQFEPLYAVKFSKIFFQALMEDSRNFQVGKGDQQPLNHQNILPLIFPIHDQLQMKASNKQIDYSLYVVTDTKLDHKFSRSFRESVRQVVEGGATIIQIRDKESDGRVLVQHTKEALEICRPQNISVVVNDRVDVAVAAGADGVHIGLDDIDIMEVRKIIGPHKIVGASVKSVEDAYTAIKKGATYLGAGALFSTNTKDSSVIGVEGIEEIIKQSYLPVVAIGGISHKNAAEVLKTRCAGIAVVSALFDTDDVIKATQDLSKIIKQARNG